MTSARVPIALTIAGSDSSGGAGIQADLKTFQTFGVHGLSVITSVTAQNSRGIVKAFDLPPAVVEAQLEALFSDFKIDAIKTGMLSNSKIIETISRVLDRKKVKNLIIDPMILSKSDFPLLKVTALQTLKKKLLPLALLVTPNLPEAEVLSGITIGARPAQNRGADSALMEAAKRIGEFGPFVLIKGGHLKKGIDRIPPGTDLFFDGRSFRKIRGKYVESARPAHGTGCVYSAAIAANLAKGIPLLEATEEAKKFVSKSIRGAVSLSGGYPFLRA